MNKRDYTYALRLIDKYPDADIEFHNGNCEPGYKDVPVITADWNKIPDDVFDKLESKGFDCEWSDEWVECSECYKVFRSSPDSYSWEMAGTLTDGGWVCINCLDPAEYYAELENNFRNAATWIIADKYNPADYGYKLVQDELENGWYPGQNADPKTILNKALQENPEGRFLFAMTSQGQFDVEFSFWQKEATNE